MGLGDFIHLLIYCDSPTDIHVQIFSAFKDLKRKYICVCLSSIYVEIQCRNIRMYFSLVRFMETYDSSGLFQITCPTILLSLALSIQASVYLPVGLWCHCIA